MQDSFYIGSYWGARSETLSEITNKTLKTLQLLSNIDHQFANWYMLGKSRNGALQEKILLNGQSVENLYMNSLKKQDSIINGYTEMGFALSLWNGEKDYESCAISFNVGTASKYLNNCCVIKLPYEGKGYKELLQVKKAKEIIAILANIWNPDHALLTSYNLGDKLTTSNKVGWITYIKTIKKKPKQFKYITIEETNSGYWFYPNGENDYDNILMEEIIELQNIII